MSEIKLQVEMTIATVCTVDVVVIPVPGKPLAEVAQAAAEAKWLADAAEDCGYPVGKEQWAVNGYGADGELLDLDVDFVVVNDELASGSRLYYTEQNSFQPDAAEDDRQRFTYTEAMDVARVDRGDRIMYWPGTTEDEVLQ